MAETAPARMNRAELTRRLVARLKYQEAVAAGIGNTNRDLYGAGHRAQNFYMLGSIGLACPIALGVALAQPDRGVVALEGDGSILMSLGCLTTIGKVAPRNLTIIVWDNGIYQATGKQPTATAGSADIIAIAKGAGISNSQWVRDIDHFDQLLTRRFGDDGPLFMAAKIDDRRSPAETPRDPALIRNRFMKGLRVGDAGALD